MQFEYTRPPMYEKQFDAMYNPKRFSFIEASTKAGKTFSGICWLFEQAAVPSVRNRNYWWVAPTYRQAYIAYDRMRKALQAVPIFSANETKMCLDLIHNGARIWFLSADRPDTLYGEDVWACVVDEASRCRELSWTAIVTTLTATNGPIRCIGNVRGRKNWFYRLAREAEKGDPDMHYAKITAADALAAGVFTQKTLEESQRMMREEAFRELYYAEPSDDGGNPFGLDKIAACIIDCVAEGPALWFGVDIARAVDWTVIIGLNEFGHVCLFERFRRSWTDTMAKILEVAKDVPCLMDATTYGEPVLEMMQRQQPNIRGFKFSGASKQPLMEGLAAAIHGKAVRFPDGPIRMELDSFEYEYTATGVRYSAPEGDHDDCVDSLALAQQCRMMYPPVRLWGGAVMSVAEIQAEAELELAERREASEKAILDGISRWGAWFPSGR